MTKKAHLLLTGDGWYPEFAASFSKCCSKSELPITFRSLEHVLLDPGSDEDYQLVVLACSRRNQFAVSEIEQLMNRFVNVPVVALSGSWCEGEMRSGKPIPGLLRVYWHQWQGSFDRFQAELAEQGVSSWNLPKIASAADRILFARPTVTAGELENASLLGKIGVSAMTQEKFQMLADGLGVNRPPPTWLETLDTHEFASVEFSAICIECNSITDFLRQRIAAIRLAHPCTPLILIMNFPRQQDILSAARLGIRQVVSKPFDNVELQLAVASTINAEPASQRSA